MTFVPAFSIGNVVLKSGKAFFNTLLINFGDLIEIIFVNISYLHQRLSGTPLPGAQHDVGLCNSFNCNFCIEGAAQFSEAPIIYSYIAILFWRKKSLNI